jgi:hypothetical protein
MSSEKNSIFTMKFILLLIIYQTSWVILDKKKIFFPGGETDNQLTQKGTVQPWGGEGRSYLVSYKFYAIIY